MSKWIFYRETFTEKKTSKTFYFIRINGESTQILTSRVSLIPSRTQRRDENGYIKVIIMKKKNQTKLKPNPDWITVAWVSIVFSENYILYDLLVIFLPSR